MKRGEIQPNLARLTRTLDQELAALVRGVSLECLVCGEFLLQVRGGLDTLSLDTFSLACLECGSLLVEGTKVPEVGLPSVVQAG
jgi:hypothetical protein